MGTKILIIQTAFIGDAILTLPLIQEVYKRYKNPSIDVICIPSTKDIFSSSPYVNKTFVLDKKNKHKSILQTIKFALTIRKNNYELLLSPHRSFRTSLVVLLSGAKNKIGFDVASLSFVYSEKIKYEKDFHEVKRNLSLLNDKKLLENWKILPECILPELDESIAGEIKGKRFITIAPGSVWATKKYPWEYFSVVISELINDGFEIALIGGSEDKELCEKIKNHTDKSNGILNFAGKLNLLESISLLKRSELLISNDSAPTHMGMCADIPVLTIYCSTVPEFGFYPYNGKSAFVSYNELDCKPCGIHGHDKCPVKTFDCGKKLLPSDILKEVYILLKKN